MSVCLSHSGLKTKEIIIIPLFALCLDCTELCMSLYGNNYAAFPLRSWIAPLKWPIKQTESSPCYPPAPMSLRFTQVPMASLSMFSQNKLSAVFYLKSILTEF